MPKVLTKGYSHLDGSLHWYGKACGDIGGGDNNDNDDRDEVKDVDGADHDDNHDDFHDHNFANNKH